MTRAMMGGGTSQNAGEEAGKGELNRVRRQGHHLLRKERQRKKGKKRKGRWRARRGKILQNSVCSRKFRPKEPTPQRRRRGEKTKGHRRRKEKSERVQLGAGPPRKPKKLKCA